MIKTRIKFQGRRVTLHGVGFNRYIMLLLGQTGLRSLRRRLTRGLGAEDTPMPPLKPGYARWKKHSNIRDLWLTGRMLLNLSVRGASENQVWIGLTSRKARMKAAINERIAHWLAWSPSDQRAMIAEAERRFKQQVSQVGFALVGKPQRSRGRAQFRRNPGQFRRAT